MRSEAKRGIEIQVSALSNTASPSIAFFFSLSLSLLSFPLYFVHAIKESEMLISSS